MKNIIKRFTMRTFHHALRVFVIVMGLGLHGGWSCSADDATFTTEIAPILSKHCAECHGEELSEAKLKLSSREALLFGSASGRVLVPGSANESLLIRLVTAGSKPHMPPDSQLSDPEILVLKKWIDTLTLDDLPPRATAGTTDHWAYRPLSSPQPPQVKNEAWPRSPIDRFVLARMEGAGLEPAPEASASALCRRVYFDLIGLPPSPAELQDFIRRDTVNENAYQELVEQLLASPHYGERWGRHWLDLARYADSSGFHEDLDRPHAWRYRDYVIQSLNEDKPYSRFVTEQLAGDELAPRDPQAWIATGFCRNGPTNDDNMGEGLVKEKYRLDLLDDVISTSSAVFLGQTIGCARCHDHKFDPISQINYYQLLAVFENTERVTMTIGEAGEVIRLTKPKPKPADSKEGKPQPPTLGIMALTESKAKLRTTHLLWRGDVANPGPVVQPGVPAAMAYAPLQATEGQSPGRSAWAEWVAAPGNPLTWRVIVNRIWQHHFHTGIVATPSNFGKSGAEPTHPELLDWLAQQMLRNGGRWKPLHREIVLSATYRQASRNDAAMSLDPNNRWLARKSPHRLEAEILRDAILTVAGSINLELAGPGIKPRIRPELLTASQRNKWPVVQKEGPEHWRRSVYIYVKRQLPFPLLELFDVPTTTQTCERRDESVVPTQALLLMNDEFTQQQASRFADRVRRDSTTPPASQIAMATFLAMGREATSAELNEGAQFLAEQAVQHTLTGLAPDEAERQALIDFCHVLFNSNEFAYSP